MKTRIEDSEARARDRGFIRIDDRSVIINMAVTCRVLVCAQDNGEVAEILTEADTKGHLSSVPSTAEHNENLTAIRAALASSPTNPQIEKAAVGIIAAAIRSMGK